MKKIEYDLPIFNDDDEADLNDYSTKMANAIKIQIDKFGNPLKIGRASCRERV